MIQLAALILLVALPGLLLRRRVGPLVRVGSALAMLGVGLAVLDLPTEELSLVPPRLAVVPNSADGQVPVTDLGSGVDARVEPGTQAPAHRLARARLREGRDPHLALVWSGRDRDGYAGGGRVPAAVLTTAAAFPLDPEVVQVRQTTALESGRPGGLEVWLGPAAPDLSGLLGELRVTDPKGAEVLRRDLAGDAVELVPWQPADPGEHQVELRLSLDGTDLVGAGRVLVAAAPQVVVVGERASDLAAALEVQGLHVLSVTVLPPEPAGTLVVLDPLTTEEQERMARFVEDGGGLFLVGGLRGGAVPGQDEPLARLSPVVRLPLQDPPPEEAGGPEKGGTGDEPPPDRADDRAQGEIEGGRLTDEVKEVERRAIAMVLVIDRSGSMANQVEGGLTRMDVVRASALQTAQALDEIDLIGVVTFGKEDGARVELPMVPVQEGARIRGALASIATKNEGTFVGSGLDAAREMLAETEAAIKYVVVITDGEFADGRGGGFVAAAKYANTRITLCVVQVLPLKEGGFGPGKEAEALAEAGNGEAFRYTSFTSVPKIVSAEVENLRTQAGRPPRKDEAGDQPGEGQADEEEEETEPPPPPPDEPETVEQPAEVLRVHILEDSALLAPTPSEGFPGVGASSPSGPEKMRGLC